MRLFYISSGIKSLSYLDPNIIDGFRKIEKNNKYFSFETFLSENEPIQNLYEKVNKFKPEVIIAFRGTISQHFLNQLKKFNVPIGVWVVDDPHNISRHIKMASSYDFVITQESSCVLFYRKNKKNCIHLPLGVNPTLYYPMPVAKKYKYDICFIGSALPIRLELFDQMTPFLLNKKFIIIGQWWERLKNYNRLKSNIINETIPPTEVVKYYNGAKIVLNIQRSNNDINYNPTFLPANTPNNRTFDIAACQSFQLISWRENLGKYYELNEEIVHYSNLNDLKLKINNYLRNEQERKKNSLEAYRRTLQDHTYVIRLEKLIHILSRKILNRSFNEN
ncbi:MAG: glycosyltransferase [Halanaerobiales bacterium]|nr:glycosyltransferase [Halanaerobiales bacterium]